MVPCKLTPNFQGNATKTSPNQIWRLGRRQCLMFLFIDFLCTSREEECEVEPGHSSSVRGETWDRTCARACSFVLSCEGSPVASYRAEPRVYNVMLCYIMFCYVVLCYAVQYLCLQCSLLYLPLSELQPALLSQ